MKREKTTATLLMILVLVSVALNTALVGAKKPDVVVNGIVTGKKENSAKGSWKYEYNYPPLFYELNIRIVEHTDDGVRQRRLETWGSCRTGFWGPSGPFIHIAEMKETSRNEERLVYIFAWGDENDFFAAVLPDTIGNKATFREVCSASTEDVLDCVKSVIETSDDVIYGETKHADF